MTIRPVSPKFKSGLTIVAAYALLGVCVAALYFLGTPFGTTPVVHTPSPTEEVRALGLHANSPSRAVCALAVSPDGSLLATGEFSGMVRLWKPSELLPIAEWQAHLEKVTALAFFSDCRFLLSSGADQTVARWSVEEPTAPWQAKRWRSPGIANALAASPDGRTVAIATEDRLGFHNTSQDSWLTEYGILVGAPIRALAFAPGGRRLASGSENTIQVWEMNCGQPLLLRSFAGYAEDWVRGVAYTKDGRTVTSIDTGGRARAWLDDGHLLGEISVGKTPCLLASYGADGRLVLTNGLCDSPRLIRLPEHWWR